MIVLATAVRFVHLAAVILLTGAVAFLLLVARPAFQRAGGALGADFNRLDRTMLRLASWSLAVALVSALVWLWVQAAVVAGRPLGQALTLDTLGAIFIGTEFGRVWQVRLAITGLVGGLLLLRGRERDDRDWWAIRGEVALLAGALLATLAWAGHAAAAEGGFRLAHLAADALHLVVAGIWLGGGAWAFTAFQNTRLRPVGKALFLLVDASMNLVKPPFVVDATVQLGYPDSAHDDAVSPDWAVLRDRWEYSRMCGSEHDCPRDRNLLWRVTMRAGGHE